MLTDRQTDTLITVLGFLLAAETPAELKKGAASDD